MVKSFPTILSSFTYFVSFQPPIKQKCPFFMKKWKKNLKKMRKFIRTFLWSFCDIATEWARKALKIETLNIDFPSASEGVYNSFSRSDRLPETIF